MYNVVQGLEAFVIMELHLAASVAVSAFVTVLAMPRVVSVLRRYGVVDRPNSRSMHASPIPRGAGFAVFIGLSAGLIFGLETAIYVWVLLVGLTALGGADDIWGLKAKPRLLFQFAITTIACVFFEFELGRMSAVALFVMILFLVASVNATNFMDGLNGMTGLHAVFFGVFYALLMLLNQENEFLILPLCLVGSVLIFLKWNFPHARVFLGDSGSYLIGGVVGLCALIVFIQTSSIVAFVPLYIYATDTGFTFLQRIARGRNPFLAHRGHIYQRMVSGGVSKKNTVLVTLAFTIVGSVSALIISIFLLEPNPIIIITLGALSVVYISLPRVIEGRNLSAGV